MSGLWKKLSEPSWRLLKRKATYGEWVSVAIAPNQVVAGMFAGALESEGIPVLTKKIGLDFPTSPSNQQSVLVPLDREQEAKQLLEGIWDINQ